MSFLLLKMHFARVIAGLRKAAQDCNAPDWTNRVLCEWSNINHVPTPYASSACNSIWGRIQGSQSTGSKSQLFCVLLLHGISGIKFKMLKRNFMFKISSCQQTALTCLMVHRQSRGRCMGPSWTHLKGPRPQHEVLCKAALLLFPGLWVHPSAEPMRAHEYRCAQGHTLDARSKANRQSVNTVQLGSLSGLWALAVQWTNCIKHKKKRRKIEKWTSLPSGLLCYC